jgi:hypothetical protein
MDKNRHIGRLIGVLVILIIVAYASGTFDSAPSTVDVPEIKIETENIESINIDRPDFSLSATKVNGLWQMTEPIPWLADSVSVRAFLKSLTDLEIESVVSTNPERYSRYGVDSTGSSVRVEFGNDELEVFVSSEGPDFSTSYVRLDGDERVFVGRPRISLPADVNRWRDRTVTAISEANVVSVDVSSPDENYSLERTEQNWSIRLGEETVPADSANVARFFSTYASLRADGFIENEIVSDSLTHRVTFRMSAGGDQSFSVSEQESELALSYSRENGAIFRFFTSRKDALVPDATTLKGGE